MKRKVQMKKLTLVLINFFYPVFPQVYNNTYMGLVISQEHFIINLYK